MSDNNVFVENNLVTSQECISLIELFDSLNLGDANSPRKSFHAPKSDAMSSVLEKVMEKTQELTGNNKLLMGDYSLSRYMPEYAVEDHVDTEQGGEHFVTSMCLYLNSDFTGGELVFTKLNNSYSPKKGDLIVFPSDYSHKTNPVLTGERYVLAMWTTEDPNKAYTKVL